MRNLLLCVVTVLMAFMTGCASKGDKAKSSLQKPLPQMNVATYKVGDLISENNVDALCSVDYDYRIEAVNLPDQEYSHDSSLELTSDLAKLGVAILQKFSLNEDEIFIATDIQKQYVEGKPLYYFSNEKKEKKSGPKIMCRDFFKSSEYPIEYDEFYERYGRIDFVKGQITALVAKRTSKKSASNALAVSNKDNFTPPAPAPLPEQKPSWKYDDPGNGKKEIYLMPIMDEVPESELRQIINANSEPIIKKESEWWCGNHPKTCSAIGLVVAGAVGYFWWDYVQPEEKHTRGTGNTGFAPAFSF